MAMAALRVAIPPIIVARDATDGPLSLMVDVSKGGIENFLYVLVDRDVFCPSLFGHVGGQTDKPVLSVNVGPAKFQDFASPHPCVVCNRDNGLKVRDRFLHEPPVFLVGQNSFSGIAALFEATFSSAIIA